MTHDITSPTHLLLNKRCEFFYSAGNVFVPMGHCTTKQLADTLDRFPRIDVMVDFNRYGDEKMQAADVKKFTRRLNRLPATYSFTGFAPKVIDGYEVGTMTGKLTRSI